MTAFTEGGTTAPAWGSVKLFTWIALGTGTTWRLGPDAADKLNSGNVLGRADSPGPDPSTGTTSRLWQDLTCDVLDVQISTGATKADGVVARAEAGSCTLTLADPDRKYDPLNSSSPWQYQGRSRLVPGCPVVVFAEAPDTDQPDNILRFTLFAGEVTSWHEPWTPHRSERRCTVTCTDATAALVALERPELEVPVGQGETVDQRLSRILDYHSAPMTLLAEPSTVHLAGTTMAGSAWDEIREAVDAEVGFAHVVAFGHDPLSYHDLASMTALRFLPRSVWAGAEAASVIVSCPRTIAATVDTLDAQVRNRVVGARKDGAKITQSSQQSIDRYGTHAYSQTDLPLADDAEVGQWVTFVLQNYAFPHPSLADVTLMPSAVPNSWPSILGVRLVSERIGVEWTPPGQTVGYSITARVVGCKHTITRGRWEVVWSLGAAETSGAFWTLGVDPHDEFDHGNVLALSEALLGPLITQAGDYLVDELGNFLVATPEPDTGPPPL
jgi:hypothetical protein